MGLLSPRDEHNRNQSRRKTVLTIAMVFLAVVTAVWSGLARRGSNIDLTDERADNKSFEDAVKQQDDPFSLPPGTAAEDASGPSHDAETPVGQRASSTVGIPTVPGAAANSRALGPQPPIIASNDAPSSRFPSASGPLSTSPAPGGGAASGSSRLAPGSGGGGFGGGGGGTPTGRRAAATTAADNTSDGSGSSSRKRLTTAAFELSSDGSSPQTSSGSGGSGSGPSSFNASSSQGSQSSGGPGAASSGPSTPRDSSNPPANAGSQPQSGSTAPAPALFGSDSPQTSTGPNGLPENPLPTNGVAPQTDSPTAPQGDGQPGQQAGPTTATPVPEPASLLLLATGAAALAARRRASRR
jgi:hypothetical protein